VSWSLDITAVPEPVNVALGTFGGLLGIVALFRKAAGKMKPAEKLNKNFLSH